MFGNEQGSLSGDVYKRQDNEAYNELIKVQSPDRSFVKGAAKINEYLKENGYEDTGKMCIRDRYFRCFRMPADLPLYRYCMQTDLWMLPQDQP